MASLRRFLGWDGPFLDRAACQLIAEAATTAQATSGEMLDLRPCTLVLPGRRAERRLLELLVDRADQLEKILLPPTTISVGALPELLYRSAKPLADDVQELLAWVEVLRNASDEELLLVSPQLVACRGTADVLSFAEKLQHLWVQELSGAQKRFADVLVAGSSMEYFTADAAWNTLEEFHQRYLARLADHGATDKYEARHTAALENSCTFSGKIYLLGIVDLKPATAAMLQQVECEVEVLINAPEELQDRFDEFGGLIIEKWLQTPLQIHESQITFVDSPDAQAEHVLSYLSLQSPTRNADEIVIGVSDEEVVPYLARRFDAVGLHARRAAGIPVTGTPLVQLLTLAHAFLSDKRYSKLAALIRHPDAEKAILAKISEVLPTDDLLTSLSSSYTTHLQQNLEDEILYTDISSAVANVVNDLFSRLHSDAGVGVAAWTDALCSTLEKIFSQPLHAAYSAVGDPMLLPASKALAQVLDSLNNQRAVLAHWTGSELFALTLRLLGKITVAEESNDAFVELLGWLELGLDDAELCVLTGMNEGFVPESVTADDLLPNSLRSRLGLLDNNRRYARDCYTMSVLLRSRSKIHFICGRRAQDGTALLPSRLLMQTDGETLLQRLLRFHHEETPQTPAAQEQFQARASSALLQPRKPPPLQTPITSISATSFRDYIACPFRFYLKHVLALESIDDSMQEMDGAHFGNLAHSVLAEVEPGSTLAVCTTAYDLRTALSRILDTRVIALYGNDILPAVRIQVEMLRLRLSSFAEWQANRTLEGWQIKHIEYAAGKLGAKIPLADGSAMALHGRIDRIDFHPHQGYQIIDYKTSERRTSPDDAHRRKNGDWIDLQLPCYWEMFHSLIGTHPCALGYVQLAPEISDYKFKALKWDDEAIADSRERMKQIAEDIHAEKFWPPATNGPAYDMFEEVLDHFIGDAPEDLEEQE